jgi:solute carrier family 35 protein E1
MGSRSTYLYQAAKVVSLCLLWYSFSSANNIVGKQILNEFPYPMTLSMVHLIAINCFLAPSLNLLDVREIPHIPRKYFVRRIIPLALGKLFASISSHISIWRVPVSYAHTVKAVMPLFTVLLSIIIMKERFTLSVYISLLPIVGGVMLATVTELSFDMLGLVAALFSTLCFALQNIYSKKCMRETRIHHLRLLLVISQFCCLFLFPVWMYTDVWQIITNLHKVQHLAWLLLGLPLSGFLAFAQNMVAFTVISIISPVSYSVANVTKRIVVISTSLLMLQNPVTFYNVCGMSIAMSGVGLYNLVKYRQTKRSDRSLLPTQYKGLDTSSSMLYDVDFTDYNSPMKLI